MPKVSYATFVDVGLVGPKARPEGVVDGQAVNIRLLWRNRLRQREDEDGVILGRNDTASKKRGSSDWKIHRNDYSSFDG